MCADRKVVYLQIGSLYFIKLPNVKKNVTLFSLLWNPEIMEWGKKVVFVEFLMLARSFCPLFFSCICVLKNLFVYYGISILHFEVNKEFVLLDKLLACKFKQSFLTSINLN